MHRQDIPKQFLELGSKPILIHTLEQFYINIGIKKIVVVVPRDWRLYAKDLLAQFDTMNTDVYVISGGSNKVISVQMIVQYIKENFPVSDGDILITHDAVRPFVTQRMINDNISTAQKYGAASTVMTTNDTIVITNDGQTLSEVPAKNKMYAEQTPLTFDLKLLAKMYDEAEKNGVPLGDESELARLYISYGYPIRLVRGEYSNMKIINSYDLEITQSLLREREQ